MRLNFSGVGEDDIREGVRADRQGRPRAGRGSTPRSPAPSRHRPRRRRARPSAPRTPTTPARASSRCGAAPAASDEPRRGAQGRAVARAPGLAALGRARAGRARAARPRGGRHRRRPRPRRAARRDARPDVAFVALHGRDGEDGTVQELLELVGIPYTASGPSACMRCMDKVLAKHALRDAGLPTPDFYAFSQTAFEALGAAHALPAIEERLDFPVVVKPAAQGSALGIRFAPSAADVPAAIVAAFSYDTKVLLERHVAGRDLAVSVVDGPTGRRRCRSSRRSRAAATSTTSRRATRSAAPTSSARRELDAETTAARAGARARRLPRARLLRLRARRPDARRRRPAS